jgi:hypothetical protein
MCDGLFVAVWIDPFQWFLRTFGAMLMLISHPPQQIDQIAVVWKANQLWHTFGCTKPA